MKRVSGYQLVFGFLGNITIIAGIIMLLPLFIIPFFSNEITYFFNFFTPGIITIVVGLLLSLLTYGKEKEKLQKNHDAIVVVLGWILLFFLCTLPFLLMDNESYNFTRSFFEVVSALTTSGLSLFNTEQMPRVFLFYRSILLFCGGMGIIIALISIFKETSAMALYNAEGHDSRIMSNIISTSRVILMIYVGTVLLGMVSFIIFGMPVFDALVHSISAVATAGFSTRNDSIGYFNNLGIEITAMLLMLVGATSFMLHVFVARRRFRQVAKYAEFKAMFIILFTAITIVALFTVLSNVNLSLREIIFHSISALTGTGFFTTDMDALYNVIPGFVIIMFVLIIFGGSSNSTSGGIKLFRVSILFKNIGWQIKDALNPNANLKNVKYIYSLEGKTVLDDKKVSKVISFVLFYLTLMIAITAILSFATGAEGTFSASMFEAANILSAAGFSMGIINYYASNVILWTSIIGLFLGRLEILIIIVCFMQISKDIRTRTKNHFN